MRIDRNRALEAYQNYAASFNKQDVKIRLKIEHTYRVAALAEQIAASLSLSKDDVDLAWLLGLLHDLGRFPQIRKYGTFNDSFSENHAAMSGNLLFQEGRIRDYIDDDSENVLIEKAVRLHSAYALPKGLSERERMFVEILRDADKVDILKVNCDFPLNKIYDVPLEQFRTAGVSEAVMQDVRHERTVDHRHCETCMDSFLAHICLVYGLVFQESIREVRKQGYLKKMLGFESDNPEAQKALAETDRCVHAYMEKRLAGYTIA